MSADFPTLSEVGEENLKFILNHNRPKIICPPESSPHEYLDEIMTGDARLRAIERINLDRKLARASVPEKGELTP